MTRDELIDYLSEWIYMSGGPSKAGSHQMAIRLVDKLISLGLLTLKEG